LNVPSGNAHVRAVSDVKPVTATGFRVRYANAIADASSAADSGPSGTADAAGSIATPADADADGTATGATVPANAAAVTTPSQRCHRPKRTPALLVGGNPNHTMTPDDQ
jgi:hypothetical protein